MSGSLMKYHPRAGYAYMPEARLRMPGRTGGYLVRANKAGFRSEREFVRARAPGMFRALLFGDSQTAGDGVGNVSRFGDLLEKAVPGLEVYNYAVSGHSPDQQLLLLEEQAGVERDLVVIGLYVENIRRINRRLFKSKNMDGRPVFRAKPYFEIEDGSLVVRNVPVPKETWTEETLPEEFRQHVYAHGEADQLVDHLKAALRVALPVGSLRRAAKSAAMHFKRFHPVPDYDRPDNPAWLLLRRLLEAFVEKSGAPVLVVLIPHYYFLSEASDPTPYQMRFREFAQDTGCPVYDLLPDMLQCTQDERRALWSDAEGHLSATGHRLLARLIAPLIERFVRERGEAP